MCACTFFLCSLLQMLPLLKAPCLFRILPHPLNTNILRSRQLALAPVCMCVCMYVCVCVCECLRVYVYVCVCVCV